MRGGHILLNKFKSMISVFHKACSRLSDSGEARKKKAREKFALSQFSAPDYLGAWNSKIWDSREALKSPIVWDFPDI